MDITELPDFSDLSEEEVNRLLQETENLYKFTLQQYVPHEKQLKFHNSLHKVRAIFGGNRSGKTEGGTNEARLHSTGDYPEWYPVQGRFEGPTRGRIVVTDYKKGAQEVLEPKILQWFPQERIIKIDRFMGHITKLYIRHQTGGISTIDVMTHEQEDAAFEGWAGHWVWFDEPPPRNKYVACMRGLVDFNGRAWLTLTPISEPWLYDEIVLKEGERVWYITVDIRDNPYLSEQAIRDFEASLLPEEIEARIHGKFIHLAGRIYKGFDTSVHLIDKLPEAAKEWPVWFVLDPADRRPHHGIWVCMDPMDRMYVFDEIVFKGTISQTSEEILVREKTKGINSEQVIRILDPNKGRTPTAATGLKLVEEFATNEVYFTCNVNDDLATGHLAVAECLYNDKVKNILPRLYFVRDSTKECVKQLLMYAWDDWKSSGMRSEKEKPKDLNKDMPDCIRYFVMFRPLYYQPEHLKLADLHIHSSTTGYTF